MTDDLQLADGDPIRCPVCQGNMGAQYHRDVTDPNKDRVSFSCWKEVCSRKGVPSFSVMTASAVPRLWSAMKRNLDLGNPINHLSQ